MRSRPKIYNLEFLKFLFAIEIVLFHMIHPMLSNIFPNIEIYKILSLNSTDGQKSVDFMFIIAGFLLTYNFKDYDYITYIKKKICRLWPIVFISLLFYLVFNYKWFNLFDNIFSLLFINNIGFTLRSGNNGTLWFISVFFWVSLIYFYLLKNYSRSKVSIISALFIWFSYSFLIHAKNGNINDQITSFDNIFNVGILRGLGGMGIGYFCALLYEQYIPALQSVRTKIVYTILEGVLLFFIIYNMLFNNLKFYNDMIFIVAFVALFWCFINHKGYFSILFENKVSNYLGSVSLSLFIMNLPIYDFFKHSLWQYNTLFIHEHPIVNIIISMCLAVIITLILHYTIEKYVTLYIKEKLQPKIP